MGLQCRGIIDFIECFEGCSQTLKFSEIVLFPIKPAEYELRGKKKGKNDIDGCA